MKSWKSQILPGENTYTKNAHQIKRNWQIPNKQFKQKPITKFYEMNNFLFFVESFIFIEKMFRIEIDNEFFIKIDQKS